MGKGGIFRACISSRREASGETVRDKVGRTDAAMARNLNSDGHVLHHSVDWGSSVGVKPD